MLNICLINYYLYIHKCIYVFELPPKAFYSILVKLEFLYGMTIFFFPFYFSTNALMTLPSVDRLRLIILPSFSLSPVAPVYEDFSDPAKSIRLMTDNFCAFLP